MAQLVREVYAQALYDATIDGNILENTYQDYKEIVSLLKAQPQLFDLFKSPKIDKQEKKLILTTVFEGQVQAELLNFLKILIDSRRTFYIIAIFEAFEAQYREHFKLQTAYIRTVTPLTPEQTKALSAKLGESTGLTIEVVNVIDPSVMGGMLIQIGDQVMDGSLKRKLSGLKDFLSQIAV